MVVLIAITILTLNLKIFEVHSAVITKDASIIGNSFDDICLTAECVKQAAYYLNNMDQNVDPCDDFYQHACGNFIKKAAMPQNEHRVAMMTLIQNEMDNDLLDGLTNEITPNGIDAFNKMKIYYQNCLNVDRIEKEGLRPYLEILEKIGGWPILKGDSWDDGNYTWEDTFVKLQHLGLTTVFPLTLFLEVDSKNETNYLIRIFSGAMISIFNETKLFEENNKTLNAYYDYMLDIAVMIGADKSTAAQEVTDWLDFEIKLLKTITPYQEFVHNSSLTKRMTIQELNREFPTIRWSDILNGVLSLGNEAIDPTDVIEVCDVNYVRKLEALLRKTPKRVVANYQIWKIISRLVEHMPKKILARQQIYLSSETDIRFNINRERECFDEVKRTFFIAINGLYVKKYFDPEIKKKVMQIAADIKNQYHNDFEKSWQTNKNLTEEIFEKLDSMDIFVGYPEELLNDDIIEEYYAELHIEPGLYFNSELNLTLFQRQKSAATFRKVVDKNRWARYALVTFVNAFYNADNIVELPAGILHKPIFTIHGPQYLNYGAVGTVIGHEMTHGLYRNHKVKDRNDNTTEKNYADEIFKNYDQCFIEKYNNYTLSENITVNGSLTLYENIPDNKGFKIAYQAYNEWTQRQNITEPHLPGLDYTPLQMFWVSAANTFCSTTRLEHLKKELSSDQHSPGEARINVAFANNNDFAKDFKCKVGTKMNPEKKCDLW